MVFWRIVNQYERMLILRFGNFLGVRQPGIRVVIPFIDKSVKIDLREQVDRVPTQKYITSDNVVVDMDFVIYWRVLDDEESVKKAVLSVEDFRRATINLSFATLRAVIGATDLAAALSEREKIRDLLQTRMDDVTARWGIKVSQVEINEIDPPPGVKEAMERQKSAAAIKTAEITESEGKRQAQINMAEGEGKYKDPIGVMRSVAGDMTKVRYARGLKPVAQRLLQHIAHTVHTPSTTP